MPSARSVTRSTWAARTSSSATPATTLDLTATFLDYAGCRVPEEMDSRSLRPFLQGEDDRLRPHVFSGLRDWRLVQDERHKLVRHADGSLLLFDLEEDPGETQNLSEEAPDVVARLLALLDSEAEQNASDA